MITLVFCDSNLPRPKRKKPSHREIALAVFYLVVTLICVAVFWMVPGGME